MANSEQEFDYGNTIDLRNVRFQSMKMHQEDTQKGTLSQTDKTQSAHHQSDTHTEARSYVQS